MAEKEEKTQPVAPVPQEQPLQFYLSRSRTYLGKTLAEELSTPNPSPVAPAAAVTKKVDHKFFTSDPGVAGTWKA